MKNLGFVSLVIVSVIFIILMHSCSKETASTDIQTIRIQMKESSFICVLPGIRLSLDDPRCNGGLFYCCLYKKNSKSCCLWAVRVPPAPPAMNYSLVGDTFIFMDITNGDTIYNRGSILDMDTSISNMDTLITITDMRIDSTW